MTNLILFPRLASHRPWADIILQNFEQAQEHYEDAIRLCPSSDYGRRWRMEAFHRWSRAFDERQAVRMRAILGAACSGPWHLFGVRLGWRALQCTAVSGTA